MRRAVPNSSLLRTPTTPDDHFEANFCPLPLRDSDQEQPNDTEKLILRYVELVKEIKALRGKLYARGIDPEKYL